MQVHGIHITTKWGGKLLVEQPRYRAWWYYGPVQPRRAKVLFAKRITELKQGGA